MVISAIKFRKYAANMVIAGLFALMLALTYMGGVMNVFSQNAYEPFYHGDVQKKNVSLMVNVYWGTEYLDDMIRIFAENEIQTTFFVGGTWAIKEDDMLKKIYDAGHEIGNHGYFHKSHDKIGEQGNRDEILNTHNLVKEILGIEMNLFAPPSGAFSEMTLKVAEGIGYKTIMWTKDTVDWRDKNTELIYERAIKNERGGDFILMHPTKNTVEALDRIIKHYKQSGFCVTTVSECL